MVADIPIGEQAHLLSSKEVDFSSSLRVSLPHSIARSNTVIDCEDCVAYKEARPAYRRCSFKTSVVAETY